MSSQKTTLRSSTKYLVNTHIQVCCFVLHTANNDNIKYLLLYVSTRAIINLTANVVTDFISRLGAHIHVNVSNPGCRLQLASMFIQFAGVGKNNVRATRVQQIAI